MMPRTFLLFFAALLGITSAQDAPQAAPTVQTNRKSEVKLPLPKDEGVFHFIIFGDRTGGPREGLKVLAQAVSDTNQMAPDLVMTVGDLINGYNTTPDWLLEAEEYKAIVKDLKMPWFPVAGNHDVYWRGPNRPEREHEANFEKHFGPLWYWFKHKGAGFVVLFSDEGNPEYGAKDFTNAKQNQMSAAQMEWFRASLAEMKDLKQVFVFLHHPRWLDNTYPGTNWSEVHKIMVEAGNVKAVFAGHIHRLHYGGKQDGIEYFALATTGGGSAGHFPGAGYLHHMNLVTVRPESFQVTVVPVGQVIDPRLYTPERQQDIDKAREINPQFISPRIAIDSEGLGAGLVRFRLTNPAKRPVEVALEPNKTSGEWFYVPDRIHATLNSGETKEFGLTVARVKKGFGDGLHLPEFQVQLDYLAEGARVPLPPRQSKVPIGMKTLEADFFTTGDNQVLRLDGKSALRVDYAAHELPDGPLTIEAWVNPAREDITAPFIAKTEQSEFALNLANNVPGFHLFLGGKYSSAIAPTDQSIPPNVWTHVAGVFDGQEMRLYVSGKLTAKTAASGKRGTNPLPLYLGADPTNRGEPTQFFTGALDEFRVSRIARYTADFQPAERFTTDVDTFLLFHCDKVVGPFVPSDSANNHYATQSGNPVFEPKK